LVNRDRCISSCSIVGRIKDTFKATMGAPVSPFQIEDVLLSEPQGLVADAIVAGVTIPGLRSRSSAQMQSLSILKSGTRKCLATTNGCMAGSRS
jgi:acyl-CoA synthetase (AMP-forming)/AMP-acid ligase II